MTAPNTGWVSLGLCDTADHTDADMIIGYVKSSGVYVLDCFHQGAETDAAHPEDTALGGTNDITVFGGVEENFTTTVEFKRALSTGDAYDYDFVIGPNSIIWAYSGEDNINLKHTPQARGAATIIIGTAE